MIEKKILAEFYQLITDNKKQLFDQISSQRTKHVTVVVENIYQEHNASAILRSCDCFGIQELHVIEKNNQYKVQRDIALGAGRWVDLFNYNKGNSVTLDCLSKLKTRGYKIIATSPYATESIFDIDISEPMAFVFGTEREGISDVVKENADSFVQIPMYGFTESFNISVSVAILLTTIRQRLESSDFYWKLSSDEQIILKNKWCKKILNGGDSMEKLFRKKHS
jgi:tRNA (guanosine-2'-O-)-methyltransferase